MIAPRRQLALIPPAVHGGRLARADGVDAAQYDFSVCLNAFGPAPIVRQAIAAANIDEYPDPAARRPRAAAAHAWNLPVDHMGFGAGAAELIQAACLAFLEPGDAVLIETPAFGEYARAARLCGAMVHEASDDAELLGIIARIAPRLVFVCSPANPDGAVRSRDELSRIADATAAVGGLLVLDQAYDAFADNPLGTPALASCDSVLYLRSLTKEHALAGVRVAFAVAHPSIIEAIDTVRVPWSASSIAQAAAEACVSCDALTHVRASIHTLKAEAARLRAALESAAYVTSESSTHFFTVGVRDAARATAVLLADARILVRDCTSFGLPTRIRVAARTPAENDVLIDAMTRLSPTLLP